MLFMKVLRQVPDEVSKAFAGFIQLGVVTQGLVVSRE